MSAADTPLSSFLIALSKSPDLLDRYQDEEQRASLLAERDLTDHPALSGELDVKAMQAHVHAEHAGPTIRRMPWIRIAKLPWKKEPAEEPKPEPPPPPPPPPTPPPPGE